MVLYDNYNSQCGIKCYDEAKQFLSSIYDEQPTDNQIWNYINAQDQFCWDSMMDIIQSYEKKHSVKYWLAIGMVGQWYGKRRGGLICESFEELLQKIGKDCDYFHIEVDRYGRLNIKCTHHDGTNYVTVKALTNKGADLWSIYENGYCGYYHHINPKRYKNEYDSYTCAQMHKVLWNSKTYSKNYGKII